MAQYARQTGGGRLPSSTAGWSDAVARFGAGDNPATGAVFVEDVFALLRTGRPATTVDGQRISLPADPGLPALPAVLNQIPECPPAANCRFVPAAYEQTDPSDPNAYGNYDPAHRPGVNSHAIGIEHEGFVADGATWFTEEMYRSWARLVRYLAKRYGIPLDRRHILGSDEIQRGTPERVAGAHYDPATYWNWPHFMELLGATDDKSATAVDSGIVTITPPFEGNEQPVRSCEPGGQGTLLPAQGTNFLYLHSAPSDDAPLIGDPVLHPDGGPGTTQICDWSSKALSGRSFALADSAGEWKAIWYGGTKGWFRDPEGALTEPGTGLLLEPAPGLDSIPVYGPRQPRAGGLPLDDPGAGDPAAPVPDRRRPALHRDRRATRLVLLRAVRRRRSPGQPHPCRRCTPLRPDQLQLPARLRRPERRPLHRSAELAGRPGQPGTCRRRVNSYKLLLLPLVRCGTEGYSAVGHLPRITIDGPVVGGFGVPVAPTKPGRGPDVVSEPPARDQHIRAEVAQQWRLPVDDLQVRLFGEVSVQQAGRSIPFPSGKALELFCYLLIHRDRAHTRETLSEVLWPGGRAAAKGYLRQALWRLNATVQCLPDRYRTETELLLIMESDWVRINPDAAWWLDVNAFEQAYAVARDTSGHSLSDGQAQAVESALELYRGDLMATWYHDWCGYERDRLQLAYLAMLDQLMGYCETRRLYAKGLGLGQVVLRYDPARECTHRQLMRLHHRAGDRTSAIRQYERCTSVMAEEFGVEPSASTSALYEQIRADRVPDSPLPLSTGPSVAQQPVPERRENAALAGLHVRLDQIQASLSEIQESVQQSNGARFESAQKIQNGLPGKNGR